MIDHEEFIDDSIGEMDLTDLELQDVNGGTWTVIPGTITMVLCTRGTLCGSCGSVNSTGCC